MVLRLLTTLAAERRPARRRMWTAIATRKKQNRNFFSSLLATITAQLRNYPAPSLLNNQRGLD